MTPNPMAPVGDGPPRQRIRLAVFMPDGSALMGRVMWLSDEHGRVGRIFVNAFTGLPGFERQEDMADVGETGPDDDDDAEMEDDFADDAPVEIDPPVEAGGSGG